MQEEISEQLDLINQVYELLIDLAVNWSFKLVGALIVLIAGFIVGRWVANLLLRVMEKRDVDVTLRQFIASTVRLIVLIMFGVIALNQLGISITPLIAAIGGLAVGLSLALQGPVSNYGAGLVIILTRMYRVGDTITTQGCSGLVEEISLASTHLRAEDGELIVIPNKHIVGEIHTNSEANRIVEGVIGIAYSAEPLGRLPSSKKCSPPTTTSTRVCRPKSASPTSAIPASTSSTVIGPPPAPITTPCMRLIWLFSRHSASKVSPSRSPSGKYGC